MHIIIAGSGQSARNNVEALLEDFLSANPDTTLVLPAFRGTFTNPQIHAAQLFEDKNLKVITVTRTGLEYDIVPYSTSSKTIAENEDILAESMPYLKGQTKGMFILWNDDDPLSVALLVAAKKQGIEANDLTDGLVTITPPKDLQIEAEPNIPEEEQNIEEDDDDDDEDDETTIQVFNIEMIEKIAEVLAKAFAKEFKALLK